MKYFIANWKANKNLKEASDWLEVFSKNIQKEDVKIIICPPYPFLLDLQTRMVGFKNLALGVQDISSFDNGAYTGEVTAQMVKDIVSYTIIGHSERRKYFNENLNQIEQKVQQAKQYNLEPILCVRDENDKIPAGVKIVAYEPVYAIGTGNNEPPAKVLEMKQKLNLPSGTIFLYGGSVDETNAKDYLSTGQIDGFLVGSASLDPVKFSQIVNTA